VAVAAVLGIASGAARAESSFTVVALPDTQFYSSTYPATFTAQTNWIKTNQVGQNIVFVTHEGDIINTYTSSTEWSNAAAAMNVLDTTSIPYATCPGNHDSNYGTSYTAYASNFGAGRYSGKPWFLATPAGSNNCLAMTFQAGSRQFLSLSLDSFKGADSITFAQNQISLHPGMPTIVTLHSYYDTGGAFTTEGQPFWDNVFKQDAYKQVFMVLCGHVHGQFNDYDLNQAVPTPQPVYEMLADYQNDANGGNGYMRLITFDPDSSKISVKSYSPTLNLFRTDSLNQFEYTNVDFSRLPEPATLSMLALGVLALVRRARKAP
jgi:hypothetical protein